MDKKWMFLSGMGVGAAVMFFLEPSAGRRRAVLRDKSMSATRHMGRFSARASRDLFNRSKGVVAEAVGRMREDHPTGEILAERVRAQIGRAVSDPGAIQVAVTDGRVTLRGPVLADEVGELLKRTERVRGVQTVVNELNVHESAGREPALQGHRRLRPGSWSPAARLLSGLAAGTVAVLAMTKRVA